MEYRVGQCGRKQISLQRNGRILLNLSTKSRKSSSRQLKTAINNQGSALRTRTIRRGLFEADRPTKKLKLTGAMRMQRLRWVKLFKNWTVDDLQMVKNFLLSDVRYHFLLCFKIYQNEKKENFVLFKR